MTFDSNDIIAFLSYIGIISVGLCYVCLTFKLNNLDKYNYAEDDNTHNSCTHSSMKSNVTSIESCPGSYNTTTILNSRNYRDRIYKNGSNSTEMTGVSNKNDQK